MMIHKKIDSNKLKIKYIIGCHQDQPDYPTAEDIIYELILSYLTKSNNKISFTDESLSKKWNLSQDKVNSLITNMLNNNWIKVSSDKNSIITYQVTKNPFYEG